jgi:hypothetical protein
MARNQGHPWGRIMKPHHETAVITVAQPSSDNRRLIVDNGSVRTTWRRWARGPKHGIARGTAIYGSRGFQHDPDGLTAALNDCRRLRDWAHGHQVTLDDHPASLNALDQALDPRRDDMMSLLENDCGLYLGTVMVRNLRHAQWHVWPNGHPVVRLSSGRTFDVVALVGQQASTGELQLADLYADAARNAKH